MFEDSAIDDRAFGNPRRYKDGGNADAEAVELEFGTDTGFVGGRYEAVRRAGGRGNVVVDAAVFVVDD